MEVLQNERKRGGLEFTGYGPHAFHFAFGFV
jgi:hypothetical protein